MDMGCDVEPSKSETVFSLRVVEKSYEDSRFQSSFKWLGYKLTIKNSGLLWFEEPSVVSKLNSVEFYARCVFQYIDSMAIRWKIWKTYFAPFVEFFLPSVFQQGFGKRTRVHVLQHRIMSWACNLPEIASIKRLEEATDEPSVDFKAKRAAERLLHGTGNLVESNIKRTSSRNTASASDTVGFLNATERKDLVFRMNLFCQETLTEHVHGKFEIKKVKNFVREENTRIRIRAANGWSLEAP